MLVKMAILAERGNNLNKTNAASCATYIINKGANFFRVGRARPVLRCRHEGRRHVVPEHIWAVVKAPVQHA